MMTPEQRDLVDRLDKVLTTHPETHDQKHFFNYRTTAEDIPTGIWYQFVVAEGVFLDPVAVWGCGATACVCGHAILLSGATPHDGGAVDADGNARHFSEFWEWGAELLGLTEKEGYYLFAPHRGDEEARGLVSIAAETGSWDHLDCPIGEEF